MAKIIATVEIEIPEPDADMSPEHWAAGFRELYTLWHPLDLSQIKKEIEACLANEHSGICEYEGAWVIDAKVEGA